MTPVKTRANVGERVNAESSAGVVIMIVIAVVLWGSAPAGIRVALAGYRPAQLSLFRFGIASVLLAVYAAFAGLRLPDKRDWFWLTLTGASWHHVLQHHPELWAGNGSGGDRQFCDLDDADLDSAAGGDHARRTINEVGMGWNFAQLRGNRVDRPRTRQRAALFERAR